MRGVVVGLVVLLLLPATALAAKPLHARVADSRASHVLRTGRLRVVLHGGRRERVRLAARIGSTSLAHPRKLMLSRGGRSVARLRLLGRARRRLRAAVARCRSTVVAIKATAHRGHRRARRRLSGGSGCRRASASAVVVPGQGPPAAKADTGP